jgi:lipopolysaccharide export system protein LptA
MNDSPYHSIACMRTFSSLLVAIIGLSVIAPTLRAQETTVTEEMEAKARALLDDPRVRNMFRSAEENPSAIADSLGADTDDVVREATRKFQETQKSGSVPSLDQVKEMDTPENRAKAQSLAEKAMSTLGRMAPGGSSDPNEVPATRPAPKPGQTLPAPPASTASPMATIPDAPALPAPPSAEPSLAIPDAASGPSTVTQESVVAPMANEGPTVPRIPSTPGLNPGEVPAPQPLAPKYSHQATSPTPGSDAAHMAITSNESIMDTIGKVMTFQGNVVITHPLFEIKCDKLEMILAEGLDLSGAEQSSSAGGESPFRKAIASGGRVEIRRNSPDGKTQVAMARRAEYDAVTKDIILSGGPPYIQDGDRFVETNSADAQIIMRGNGKYEVRGERGRIVIPVDKSDTGEAFSIGPKIGG